MDRSGSAAARDKGEAQETASPPTLREAYAPDVRPEAPQVSHLADNGGCMHSGAPCPALAGLVGHRSTRLSAEALAWSRRLAPCSHCSVALTGGLKGLRLGKHERAILMGAAAGDLFVVTAPGMTRAVSGARRRAAQTLVREGLVRAHAAEPAPPAPSGLKGRAAVTMTPFGHYTLAAYGRFIAAGKPVRWDRPRAGVPLPGRSPQALAQEVAERTRAELQGTLDDLKRVLIAAVGRPVRDPRLLDTVTQHLEEKAKGLRDLLEPPG